MNNSNLSDTAELPLGKSNEIKRPEPISAQVRVEFGSATHIGRVRAKNEDSFLISRLDRTLRTISTNLPPDTVPIRFDEVTYGMLVADGLGGARGGEVASQLAIGTFINLVLHTPDLIMRVGNNEADLVMDRISERYRQVGETVSEKAVENAALTGMGTTMTFACSNGPELFIGHVGDSRAYLIRAGVLIRLTRDHTYAQELADSGMITQREVERHRFRHVLTRALGKHGRDIDVDVTRLGLEDGDQLLLCTDGLTGMIPEETICGLIKGRTPQEACDVLVTSALDAGGKDNVTVTLAAYQFPVAS